MNPEQYRMMNRNLRYLTSFLMFCAAFSFFLGDSPRAGATLLVVGFLVLVVNIVMDLRSS